MKWPEQHTENAVLLFTPRAGCCSKFSCLINGRAVWMDSPQNKSKLFPWNPSVFNRPQTYFYAVPSKRLENGQLWVYCAFFIWWFYCFPLQPCSSTHSNAAARHGEGLTFNTTSVWNGNVTQVVSFTMYKKNWKFLGNGNVLCFYTESLPMSTVNANLNRNSRIWSKSFICGLDLTVSKLVFRLTLNLQSTRRSSEGN